jgi:hypothetical protein
MRYPVTVRLNNTDREYLRKLQQKYGKTDREIIKMAFYLLVDSFNQLERRLEQGAKDEETTNTSTDSNVSSSPNTSDDAVVSDTTASEAPSAS